MKPYYQNANITVYHGDCLNVLKTLPDNSVDLIPTDPPYNVGYGYNTYKDSLSPEDYIQWQLALFKEFERVLKPGGSVLYLHYPEFAARVFTIVPEVSSLKAYELIAWTYNQHTGGSPFRKGFRLWAWFVKGQNEPAYIGESATKGLYKNPEDARVAERIERGLLPTDYDWWHYEQVKNVSSEKTDHPCQVPEVMVRRIISLACPSDGLVFEPFLGSGTTAVSAHLEGRHCIASEQDVEYINIAVRRLQNRQAQLNLF